MEVLLIPAEWVALNGNDVTVQFTVKPAGHMLDDEQTLQQSLNEADRIVMPPMLKQFDTQGEPLRVKGVKHTVPRRSP